jgi:hypothetical protein
MRRVYPLKAAMRRDKPVTTSLEKAMRVLLFLVICAVGLARAEPVTLTLPNHLVALAEYRKGADDMPAVILLHGFLQTHEFPTSIASSTASPAAAAPLWRRP